MRETIGEHFRQLVEVSRTKGRIEVLSAEAFVDETKIGICVMRVWRQQQACSVHDDLNIIIVIILASPILRALK